MYPDLSALAPNSLLLISPERGRPYKRAAHVRIPQIRGMVEDFRCGNRVLRHLNGSLSKPA